jgi:hypothetical protein
MRDYRMSTVIKMKHYFHLYNHPRLFLLPHLKQRLFSYHLLHSSSGGIKG